MRVTFVSGVSRDTMAKHDHFAAKTRADRSVLADIDGAVTEAMASGREKHVWQKNPWGSTRATYLNDANGNIARNLAQRLKFAGHVRKRYWTRAARYGLRWPKWQRRMCCVRDGREKTALSHQYACRMACPRAARKPEIGTSKTRLCVPPARQARLLSNRADVPHRKPAAPEGPDSFASCRGAT